MLTALKRETTGELMEKIMTRYLTWIKNVDEKIHGRDDCYNLASSGIDEPTDLLASLIARMGDQEFRRRLDEPNPWGQPTLISGIAKRYRFPSDRVLLTNGVSAAMYLICRALLRKGDHVIVEEPIYEPLLAAPASQGAQLERLRRNGTDYSRIDLDELEDKVTSQTKLIVLTNLHNPSGAWLGDETLVSISRIARKRNNNIKILVDEIFHDFIKQKQIPAAALDDSFISMNGLSKVYGLSLLRCGWILASPEVLNDIRQVSLLVENNGSRLTETLAALVIENLDEFDEYWGSIISQNEKIVRDVMKPLIDRGLIEGIVPINSCIYFPKIDGVRDTREFAQQLSERRKVYIVPGYFFGAQEHIRIGLGCNNRRLQIGLERLADEILSRQ